MLLIFPQQFKSCYKIGLLGVSICYILNIKILVALMNDPYKIKSKSQDKTNFSRVIIASILIVVLIILNLYLAVCFVSDTGKEAFSNSPNYLLGCFVDGTKSFKKGNKAKCYISLVEGVVLNGGRITQTMTLKIG